MAGWSETRAGFMCTREGKVVQAEYDDDWTFYIDVLDITSYCSKWPSPSIERGWGGIVE